MNNSFIFGINAVHNDSHISFRFKLGRFKHITQSMFGTAFYHVCNLEVIIPEYHLSLYHLISWYHDSLCSSLETAVFIVLRNFESSGNFVILLITSFYYFSIWWTAKVQAKIPVRCVWKVIIYLLLYSQVLYLIIHKFLRTLIVWCCPVFHC